MVKKSIQTCSRGRLNMEEEKAAHCMFTGCGIITFKHLD